MNKKNITLGLIAVASIAVAASSIALNNNFKLVANSEPVERSLVFTNSQDVVSSGGSSFYLTGISAAYNSKIHFNSTGSELGKLDNYTRIQVNCRETESVAKFASVYSISLTYSMTGPEADRVVISIGDAETGDFNSNIKETYSMSGTNATTTTKTFVVSSSNRTNSIVKIANESPYYLYITSIKVTYTC